MHGKYFLIILALVLSVGLFAFDRIYAFATQEHIILGSWRKDEVSLDFSYLGETTQKQPGVLGNNFSTSTPQATSANFQAYLFDQYLAGSPLEGQGQTFIDACKEYGAPDDCLLLLGLSKVETNHCRTDISAQQFNCWGWGGSPPNRIEFNSFEEAIDTITRNLMRYYGTRFFENANNGALYYCGRHCVRYGDYVEGEKRRINQFLIENGHESVI
ncbi:MAG: hypothetical protein ACOCXP_01310 [Candidatus Dojkabacteria bacterium]